MHHQTVLLFTLCAIFTPSDGKTDVSTLQIPETKWKNEHWKTTRECILTLIDMQKKSLVIGENCCLTLLCSSKNMSLITNQNLCEKFMPKNCSLNEHSISSTLAPPFLSHAQARNSQTKDKKIRFVNITKISARISGLQFLDVPKGEEMRIHNVRVEEKYLLFEVCSSLMGYLQPAEISSELLEKQALHLILFQILQNENFTLGWIIFCILLTMCSLTIIFFYCCCKKRKFQRLHEDGSEVSVDFRDKCVEKTFKIILLFFLLLQIFPIISICVANEQISRQISGSTNLTNIVFDDLKIFTRNVDMQMSFVATSSTDFTIEAIHKTLDDVEILLGQALQEEINRKTGINNVLKNLEEIKTASDEVTSLVSQVVNECFLADTKSHLLQEQLDEIGRQLTIVRRQCRARDRALCYTLEYSGLETVFSCGNLTSDAKVKQLAQMHKERNFGEILEKAKSAFAGIPQKVVKETAQHISDMKSVLARKRADVYKATHSLNELSNSLADLIRIHQQAALEWFQMVNRWEVWRWLSVLGLAILSTFIWILLFYGSTGTSGVVSVLSTAIIFISLISVPILLLATLSFLLGIHGQALICQPLYDQSHYKGLEEILNFESYFKQNESLKVEDVLNNCQLNQPVFSTFKLRNKLDPSSLTNYMQWQDFRNIITNFSEDFSVEILSPSLQLKLQFLTTVKSFNFTKQRMLISGPLTRRDLNAFADQLNTVARQLSDPSSAKKIDSLAFSVRKIIHNERNHLNDLRNRIVYKVTALEFLIEALSEEANGTLEHLKNVQFFLDNHFWESIQKNNEKYISLIESDLRVLKEYVAVKISRELGRCKPLWDIFNTVRFTLCKLTVDPINGISVSSFALILLFFGIVIVVLNLVEHYRERNEELLTSVTHRRTRDGVIIDDEGTWATPQPMTPPEQVTWRTPRLSTITSRISAARVAQIPSVSGARSPRR